MQARDARRILQDAAPLHGLCRDQLGDLALPHQRGGMRAGGGVGEEELHVARAHLAPVDAVGGARLPLDPAGDLERLEPLPLHLALGDAA